MNWPARQFLFSALLLFVVFCAAARVVVGEENTAVLRGRVFERGSINALADVRIIASTGEETTTDAGGRFRLELHAGQAEIVVISDSHEPLRRTETLKPGEERAIEVRLLPLATHHRYESTVRAERHTSPHLTLREEELRQLPGSLGDPFRIVGTLPGVATPIPLLPYFVIRGATPGMNGFFLDGMRVPQLFHFLVGGGVVHGRLIDRLDFYPGSYDASFGRYAGGIVDAETRPARQTGYHGEVELRLYDISLYAEAALPKEVRLEVSGHYGYPGFLIRLVEPQVDLQYGDFQLRLDWRGLTVEALGSYDSLTTSGVGRFNNTQLGMQFYRLQIRHRQRRGRAEIESAIVGGIDQLVDWTGSSVRKYSLGARLLLRAQWARWQVYAGVDGELSRFSPAAFAHDATIDEFGDLATGRDGQVVGGFAQATVEIVPHRLQTTLGVRGDVYHVPGATLIGVDPRLQTRAQLLPWLSLHGGIGLYQQPPSFPLPLPGIDTFSLQLGLQRAWQGSVSVEASLPQNFTFSLTGIYHRLFNGNDVVTSVAGSSCNVAPVESLSGAVARLTRQVDGNSYGMELMLRRQSGRITGWIAYTLSRSERMFPCGIRPADFDQTHLLNIVVQARLPWKLFAGVRLYVATGRPYTRIPTVTDSKVASRNDGRLPNYVQLDLRLDREWLFKAWALSLFVEVVNLTYAEAYLGVNIHDNPGMLVNNAASKVAPYDPSRDGLHFILPSIGLRGHF